jgi:hypothetical protein
MLHKRVQRPRPGESKPLAFSLTTHRGIPGSDVCEAAGQFTRIASSETRLDALAAG